MKFSIGDSVVHWNYGIGQVIQLEERTVSDRNIQYYAVQIGDMTVWVPADDKLEGRLRHPTSEKIFKKMLTILSDPSEPLPEVSPDRRRYILELLKEGRVETLCRAIRDLSATQDVKPLNDYDKSLLKHMQALLIGEWGLVLSITPASAERELNDLLAISSKHGKKLGVKKT